MQIRLGGYASASNVQVQAAYKCAVVLKEIIDPFILRRFKADVAVLPDKQDLVLFCNPVQKQKDDYEAYLKSKDVGLIFEGKPPFYTLLISYLETLRSHLKLTFLVMY